MASSSTCGVGVNTCIAHALAKLMATNQTKVEVLNAALMLEYTASCVLVTIMQVCNELSKEMRVVLLTFNASSSRSLAMSTLAFTT